MAKPNKKAIRNHEAERSDGVRQTEFGFDTPIYIDNYLFIVYNVTIRSYQMSRCITKKSQRYPMKRDTQTKKVTTYHRWIWEQHHGTIPKGLVVRHKCDNKNCINIDHLELGTHKDNIQDKVLRDRCSKGIDHPPSKLQEQDILDIRQLYNNGMTISDITRRYSVTRTPIHRIVNRITWKHI